MDLLPPETDYVLRVTDGQSASLSSAIQNLAVFCAPSLQKTNKLRGP
jgi:hypothetical protein